VGAPFVPTAREKHRALFGDAGLLRAQQGGDARCWLRADTRPCELNFVDLGSGDGSLLRAAARDAGYRHARGYETNPLLAGYSALRSRPNETVHWQSLWEADLDDAHVVFAFGNGPIMDALGAKLRAELPVGAVVVSNAYELPQRCFGAPKDAEFVTTTAVAAGLRDTSSYLFCYEQTAETRAAAAGSRGAHEFYLSR